MSLARDLRRIGIVDRMIKTEGDRCVLRRDSGDRECWACVVDYSANERRGELIQTEDRLGLISANGLTVPPDTEQGDRLVTFMPDGSTEDEVFHIVNKPSALKQGRTAIYYECQLRPTSND
jgi:hypothetical protein